MRVLHTSDWHLGLETAGHDRLPEQAVFLDWLLDTLESEAADALVVAGDVFDVVNPSVAAQSLFAGFLARLRARLPACEAVVVAGNHDSGSRLEIPRPFGQALGGLHLVGTFQPEIPGRHRFLLHRAGVPAAWCVAVPFLRGSDLDCRVRPDESVEAAFVRALREAYSAQVTACHAERPDLPVLATGHLTLSGSDRTGSERLLVGGVESIPVDAIAEGVDYLALGHIHRAQCWKDGAVRYPGSPLPIDFDERNGRQRVLLVELGARGQAPTTREIEVPRPVPLVRLPEVPGSWEAAEEALRAFDDTPWQGKPAGLQPLIELRYVPDGPRPDLRERLDALCRGRAFRLAGTPRAMLPEGRAEEARADRPSLDLKAQDAPMEVLDRHWAGRYGGVLPEELRACFREAEALVATGEGR